MLLIHQSYPQILHPYAFLQLVYIPVNANIIANTESFIVNPGADDTGFLFLQTFSYSINSLSIFNALYYSAVN